jgi:hypothetical protein
MSCFCGYFKAVIRWVSVWGCLTSVFAASHLQILDAFTLIDWQGAEEMAVQAPVADLAFPRRFSLDVAAGESILLVRNNGTAATVAFRQEDRSEGFVVVSAMLWKELSENRLGTGASYAWTVGRESGKGIEVTEAWKAFQFDAEVLERVSLPVFNFRTNGVVVSTGTTNRSLVATVEVDLMHRITLPGAVVTNRYQTSYLYELPDGRRVATSERRPVEATGESVGLEAVSIPGELPFSIVYTDAADEGFFDVTQGAQRREALEFAVRKWAATLQGPVPVVIKARFTDMGEGVLGSCGPAGYLISEPGDLMFNRINTGYVSALGNQRINYDFDPSGHDINVQFSNQFIPKFYFGTDGFGSSLLYDFVTIVLHELAHGLGFIDGLESDGEFFYTDTPFVFDHYLYYNGAGIVSGTVSNRLAAITSGALYWDGVKAKTANEGARIKMYAPSSFESGSSVAHFDPSVSFTTLMKPRYERVIHTIDPCLEGAMEDMEWQLAYPAYTFEDWVKDEDLALVDRGLFHDPAGDGIENLWKYAVGLPANQFCRPEDLFTWSMDASQEHLTLFFKQSKRRVAARIVPAWAGSLLYSGWETGGVSLVKLSETADQESWKATIPVSADSGFFRIRVEME